MRSNSIIWPTENPILIHNFLGTGLDLLKEQFGALSQDDKNPLSRVTVANSTFSFDPIPGCPLACSYCIVGGDLRNLGVNKNSPIIKQEIKNFRTLYPRKPEVVFTGRTLARALFKHPAFIKNKSVISIATGSTEAFIPVSEKETWGVMKTFADEGLKNPFWIVTKRGIPDELLDIWLKRFEYLLKKGVQIVISITYSNAPYWVEPYRRNRFHNFDAIKKTGVHISQHLRPIIRGINDNKESIQEAVKDSLGLVESICVGGLRKDPGVLLAWQYSKGLDPNLLPDVKKDVRKKDLPGGTLELVREIVKEKGYNTPVFYRSSHVISRALGIPDYNLYRYRDDDNKKVFLKIPVKIQRDIEKKSNKSLLTLLKEVAVSIKLDYLTLKIDKEEIFIENKVNYQEHRALIHAIGHSEILP